MEPDVPVDCEPDCSVGYNDRLVGDLLVSWMIMMELDIGNLEPS